MLTQNDVKIGALVADYFASKGQSLQALDQTPLSALIASSMCVYNDQAGDAAGQLQTGSMFADPSGKVQHDLVMEEAVQAVSRAIGFNLSLARNTVNPIVKQVRDDIVDQLSARQSAGLSPLAVVPFQYPALWNSPVLVEYVARYGEQVPADVTLSIGGLAVPGDLKGALLTGGDRFDAEITQFANQVGDGAIAAMWDALFGTGGSRQLSEVLAYRLDNLNAPVLAFLLANRAEREIPEGVNADAMTWKLHCTAIAARAGNAIVRNLKLRGDDSRMKRLVLRAPVGDEPEGDIIVNGDVYNQWLNDGGTPEVLFGALYAKADLFYNSLLQNAETYRQSWKNAYRLLQNRAAGQRFGDLVAATNAAMSKAINELDDNLLVEDRGALHARLAERLQRVQPRDLDDLYYLARKSVCRVMFPHTDAEGILNEIDVVAKANPDMDLREVALLATIDFTAKWLAKLVTVVQVNQG